MKTTSFPLSYFKSTLTPTRMFEGRHQLNWFTLLIILVFLNGLLSIPTTLNYATGDRVSIQGFYPDTFDLIDQEVVDSLAASPQTEEGFTFSKQEKWENENGVVVIGDSEAETISAESYLLFKENEFSLKGENVPQSNTPYTMDFKVSEGMSAAELIEELNRQWFIANRVFIVGAFSFMITAMLFIMMTLMVFGSAVFLYLTKKSSVTSIGSYKESVTVILNALGLPTFAVTIIGLLYFDISLMITLQMFGLALMLVFIYYKTQFLDEDERVQVQE
ncbi:hypothetical protein [Lacticigenium naphthae]|uniref:hypothetical protein n=1 Tax=Lacticigenium naphthae TaxID=515351 RepID=UPI000412F3D9|nr:hypothetical protein [Lacticigenium naphthae]